MLGNPVTFRAGPLRGTLSVPGDKSISHRSLIASARLREPVTVSNLNPGRDVLATERALRALGVAIEREGDRAVIAGSPLRRAESALDCMNSGSTARMMLGVCAGANLPSVFDGDESLRRRPMEPVAAQLRAFGAKIDTREGRMPVRLHGTPEIETRHFILISPSAQVKSALLFAALFAGREVTIDGDRGSRDHTEHLLAYLGADIEWNGRSVALGTRPLTARSIDVAGDFSSAAFFITAAAVAPGSSLTVTGVGVNPTRTGLLDVLEAMGAQIELRDRRTLAGEPVADVAIEYAPLRATNVSADTALRAIDEIPLVAVAAAFAEGETKITGVKDLRTKESDRIAAIERLLGAAGIDVVTTANALSVRGGTPAANGSVVETRHDHRTAMAAAVLACGAGAIAIDTVESIDVSFPRFLPVLESVRA